VPESPPLIGGGVQAYPALRPPARRARQCPQKFYSRSRPARRAGPRLVGAKRGGNARPRNRTPPASNAARPPEADSAGGQSATWRKARSEVAGSQGLNLKDVSETLGHSRIAVTVDLYGHMYDERRREIADRMDAILAPVG
jgi:hypothetical protein